MKTYMCIKKCQHEGKIWRVGEILDTDKTPPAHCFKSLDEKITEIKKEKAVAISEIKQARTELTELGVPFDKRYGLTKLKGEVTNAKKMGKKTGG